MNIIKFIFLIKIAFIFTYPYTPFIDYQFISGNFNNSKYGDLPIYGPIGQFHKNYFPGRKIDSLFLSFPIPINTKQQPKKGGQGGNMIIFGGEGLGYESGLPFFGKYNDVWKYDINLNEFAWIKGNTTINGKSIKGIIYEYGENVQPDGTSKTCFWKMENGFFMIGGEIFDQRYPEHKIYKSTNQVFQYDMNKNQFRLCKNEGYEEYGEKGIYNENVIPMKVSSAGCQRISMKSGYMFGGWGDSQHGNGNDLFEFSFDEESEYNLQFRFLKGSKEKGDKGNYGEKGVVAETNLPPSRSGFLSWSIEDKYFFVYGGYNMYFSDMWRFEVNGWNWVWIAGRRENGKDQIVTEKFTFLNDDKNTPSSIDSACSWIVDDLLYFFGGYYGQNDQNLDFFSRNDIWAFHISSNKFMWINGTEKNIGNQKSYAGTRFSHSCTLLSSNEIYIFSGEQKTEDFSFYNDLWKLNYKNPQKCYEKYENDPEVCNSHGKCVSSECVCFKPLYFGQQCDEFNCFKINCKSPEVCNKRGKCLKPDECTCTVQGYGGNDCELIHCYNYWSNSKEVCSGHGICIAPDVCDCDNTHKGKECDIVIHGGKGVVTSFIIATVVVIICVLINLFIIIYVTYLCRKDKKLLYKLIKFCNFFGELEERKNEKKKLIDDNTIQ